MIKYLVPRISQEIFVFPSEYFIYSTPRVLFWRALRLGEVKAQTFYMPWLPEGLSFQETECHELPLTQKEFRTSSALPGSSPQWSTSKPLQWPRAQPPSLPRGSREGSPASPSPAPALATRSYTAGFGSGQFHGQRERQPGREADVSLGLTSTPRTLQVTLHLLYKEKATQGN